MNRNVTIVVIILVLVVIAGYLVWIRSRYQPPASPKIEEQVVSSPTPVSTPSSTPTASPKAKEATGSTKPKTATSPAVTK